jgi:hypothetical protein
VRKSFSIKKTETAMKNILRLIAMMMVLAGGLGACHETVTERTQILIQNRTDSLMHVRLFPKEKYMRTALLDTYSTSDVGSDGNHTEYDLPSNEGNFDWSEIIFSSSNLDIAPYTLAAEVFDSIYICAANKDSVIIKLTHDSVTGYSENIFSEHATMSVWKFGIVDWNLPTQHRKNPHKYYQYRFQILKEKMINNQ